jgi:uncharacterized iron-regulated protein
MTKPARQRTSSIERFARDITSVLHVAAFCALTLLVPFAPARAADTCAGELVGFGAVYGTKAVSVEAVVNEIRSTGIVLLGERHGIRGHTEVAACLLRLLTATKPTAVVLEMLARDQQSIVDLYRRQHPEIVDGLGTELRWWETGWPAWGVYTPLFEEIWRTRSWLLAGDQQRATPPVEMAKLEAALGAHLTPALASWSKSMKSAHCDLIDDAKAATLAQKQASRDLAMTEQLLAAAKPDTVAFLYVGRAHIRRDRGVALHVAHAASARKVVTIALHETSVAGKPVDRDAVLADAKGRVDYVWFVGAAEAGETCERLRAKGLIAAKGKPL